MVASRQLPVQTGQNRSDIIHTRKGTYVQHDAVRQSHLDGAALVYLELANLAIDVCWRLLLVYVLGHGRGRFCIG